jgi:hypothetical protein
MLPLAIGIVALLPSPMAARSKDGLLSAPTLRCSIEAKLLSPAYDGTRRYAAADWVQNIKTFPRSIVLKRISSPLMFNFLATFVTCWLYAVAGLPSLLPPLPHTLLGSALGLLLVFRTNAAYDRFWEARKQWGIVSSECRQLAGLACTFMTPLQVLSPPPSCAFPRWWRMPCLAPSPLSGTADAYAHRCLSCRRQVLPPR